MKPHYSPKCNQVSLMCSARPNCYTDRKANWIVRNCKINGSIVKNEMRPSRLSLDLRIRRGGPLTGCNLG